MSLDVLTKAGASEVLAPRRKWSLTWLLPVGLLVGFATILAVLFGDRLIPATEVEVAPVVTVRAGEGEVVEVGGQMLFQASGWVEPDPYTTYVPSLINGIVSEVYVLEGQRVEKGQLLATLIDDDQKLALQAATQKVDSMEKMIHAHCQGVPILEAQIAASQKKIAAGKSLLDQEKDNLKRLEGLGGDAVSVQSVVQARFAVTRNEALVAQAEAELPELAAKIEQINAERESMQASLLELKVKEAQAKLALERTKISSPIDGVVLHLHVAPGKKRMLNMDDAKSSVIVELYDPEQLQARIDVPLNEAAGLSVGQRVEMVSDLFAQKVFIGEVTRLSGQADLQRNTLQAKVAIKNPDARLRPDMLVRAKFYSPEGGGAEVVSTGGRLSLYVPEGALVDEDEVWVVGSDGKAELRDVELGNAKRDGHVQVLRGVKSGEKVILPPHAVLNEGLKLKF
ncbi:efflux RND transporter periplasmic adaptor subunit [Rubritalea tangerina]|uniref:Efflux RND transporter periplasmic adaptor subunit n=2 Tax=Rubritalea tangerina TaxID=430798 RepID=A0ABW4Z7J6_9BACT